VLLGQCGVLQHVHIAKYKEKTHELIQ
jgi:hypothetical protein